MNPVEARSSIEKVFLGANVPTLRASKVALGRALPGTWPKYLIQTGRSPADAGLRSLDPVSSAPGGTIKAGTLTEGHQL